MEGEFFISEMTELRAENGFDAAKLDVGTFTIAATPMARSNDDSLDDNQPTSDIVITVQGAGVFLLNVSRVDRV